MFLMFPVRPHEHFHNSHVCKQTASPQSRRIQAFASIQNPFENQTPHPAQRSVAVQTMPCWPRAIADANSVLYSTQPETASTAHTNTQNQIIIEALLYQLRSTPRCHMALRYPSNTVSPGHRACEKVLLKRKLGRNALAPYKFTYSKRS